MVRELSIAANIPPPATYVIEDGSQNAFATGRDPEHASIAVTRGLLERMDREELQGVIGHELGHVRNLDTRYALYVAVLVGLVAIVTDGFLRMIVEAWRHGAFYWKGEGKNAAGALVAGLCVGLFLLIVAALLRLSRRCSRRWSRPRSSRQREFLADATSVEFTRNPRALERALTSIAADSDTLEAANRGTQHLWFRNPVKAGSDRRTGLLSTHPSLAARIDRLRTLQGLGPVDPESGRDRGREADGDLAERVTAGRRAPGLLADAVREDVAGVGRPRSAERPGRTDRAIGLHTTPTTLRVPSSCSTIVITGVAGPPVSRPMLRRP